MRTARSRLQRSLSALKAEADALCRGNAELNAQAWLIALLLRHCDALVELSGTISQPYTALGTASTLSGAAAPGTTAANSSSSMSSDAQGNAGAGLNTHTGRGSFGGQNVSGAMPQLLAQLLRQEQARASQARQSAAAAGGGFPNGVAGEGSNAKGGTPDWDGPLLLPLGWRPMAAAATWLSGGAEISTAALKRVAVEFVQCASLVGP